MESGGGHVNHTACQVVDMLTRERQNRYMFISQYSLLNSTNELPLCTTCCSQCS